jgi:hypothetical protein
MIAAQSDGSIHDKFEVYDPTLKNRLSEIVTEGSGIVALSYIQ